MRYLEKDISVEKYNVNGNVDWFHHLYLENEADKLMAIMYCPYCGCKLDQKGDNMERMCSMCREVKDVSEFRVIHRKNGRNEINCYCKDCERWYMKMYTRVWRARKKDEREKEKMRNAN